MRDLVRRLVHRERRLPGWSGDTLGQATRERGVRREALALTGGERAG